MPSACVKGRREGARNRRDGGAREKVDAPEVLFRSDRCMVAPRPAPFLVAITAACSRGRRCCSQRPQQAEDQFQTALRAHLQNMDQLIDLQDSRLLALEQEFEVELQTLQRVRRRRWRRCCSYSSSLCGSRLRSTARKRDRRKSCAVLVALLMLSCGPEDLGVGCWAPSAVVRIFRRQPLTSC